MSRLRPACAASRLTDAGVIERTVAILSPEALGHGLTAIVEITLDRQAIDRIEAFEARAVAEPGAAVLPHPGRPGLLC